MAVRLTVVISQVQGGSRQQQEREANLIAALIGCPGIDVSLIGSLSEVAESATDRLVLEGLSGDFALVAWHPPAEVVHWLARLEIAGYRAPHAGDPEAAKQRGRRVYCFDAGASPDAEALVTALGELLSTRQVQTVSLAPPSSPLPEPSSDAAPTAASDGAPAAAQRAAAQREAAQREAVQREAVQREAAARSSAEATAQAARGGPPTGRDAADGSPGQRELVGEDKGRKEESRDAQLDARLDALVDDLNLLDL